MTSLKTIISEIVIAAMATGVVTAITVDQVNEALDRIDELNETITEYHSEIEYEINREREVHK